jgi:type VI secretion system secreted protein Hcp
MRLMKIVRLALAGCVFVICGTSVVQAAPEFYVSIVGSIQGPFKGEINKQGFDGKIAGLNFDYAVVSPRDAATGQALGKRMHKPIRIKKAWGAASTQLFNAVTKNEALTSVVIDFFAIDPKGQNVLDHTIKLTNAFVSSIEHSSDSLGVPPPQSLPAMETIEFTFQQIELIDHRSKTIAMDSSLVK